MRRTLTIASLTVLGLLTLFLVRPDGDLRESLPSSDGSRPELSWDQGTQYEYRIAYDSRSQTAYPTDAQVDASVLDVRTSLEGRLLLSAYGRTTDGHFLLGWRLADLETAAIEAFGTELLPTDEEVAQTFGGREALVEVAPGGEIVAVEFKADAPRLFTNVARLLIADLQVRLDGVSGQDWTVDERGYYGVAPTDYRIVSNAGQDWTLRKMRERYDSFRGLSWLRETIDQDTQLDAEIRLENGHVESFAGTERIRVRAEDGRRLFSLDTSLHQKLVATRPIPADVDVADLRAGRQRHQIDRTLVDSAIERSLLESQADGLTWEEVTSMIARHGVSEDSAGFNRWLWRAVGLLKLHPELVDGFVPLFDESAQKSRQLILGLLGNVGHPEAQDAMLTILASDAARSDVAAYFHYVQRLSLIDAPTPATATFAVDEYDRAPQELRVATAYTLGNVIRGLETSDEAFADELNARLAADLRASTEPDDRRVLVSALGATGRDENVDVIASLASDADSTVRAAAARALVKTQTPTSEETLLQLTADESTSVQRSALRTLTQYELSQNVLEELSVLVESGRVARSNYAEVHAWVLPQIADRETVRRLAQHMLDNAPADARLESRLRKVLGASS